MNIEYININQLIPAEYNPRTLRDDRYNKAYREMEREQWQWLQPIIINKSRIIEDRYVIVGGNQRYNIARRLYEEGYKRFEKVPVLFVEIDDIREEEKLNIKLNNHWGEWDFDMLSNLDFEVPELIDMGFTEMELSKGYNLDLDMIKNLANGMDLEDIVNDKEEDGSDIDLDKSEKIIYKINLSFSDLDEFKSFRKEIDDIIKEYETASYSIED